jgi:thiamine-monophosphate kinase
VPSFATGYLDYRGARCEEKAVTVTEDELVHAIRKVLSGEAPGVVIPVGDDAAVIEPGEHQLALTADILVEGVHFDPRVTSAHDLGHKSLAVNISDIAAMGGSPRFAIVCIAVPPESEPAWVMALYGGIREAGDEYGVTVVGGDTVRGEQTVIAPFLVGAVPVGRAVTRGGARPGDWLVVTGALGAAAGGLRLMQAETEAVRPALATDWERELIAAHERPVARIGEGQVLSRLGATAMIDVSDGLALDLARICEESGTGARLRLLDVPVSPALEKLAGVLDIDPLDLALHGGEDYELLAALPSDRVTEAKRAIEERFGTSLTEIGEVTEAGLVAVGPNGTERPLERKGWDHFA